MTGALRHATVVMLALLFPLTAFAQTVVAEGRWAVRSLERPMVILSLEDAGGRWRGEIERPTAFTSDASMSAMIMVEGPKTVRAITSAEETADGLVLSVAPRVAGGLPDLLLFSVLPDGTARLKPQGFPGAGFVLDRAAAGEPLFTGWRDGAAYPLDQHWTTSAEMKRLFEEDQAARMGSGDIDWAKVSAEDAKRREATRALLDAGKLQSADDFYHAAFVFQHGDKPDDYLLAHTLAVVAAARGQPAAPWIAAATLDRYLQSAGQAQIYGTQFKVPKDAPATQEPYNRELISDALRGALGVPALVEQEKQREAYSAGR